METTTRQSAVGNGDIEEWELPFKSVLGCLLQAALMAARHGMPAEAEAILKPVEAVRPAHPSTRLARGLSLFYQDRYQEAIDFLDREILKEDPDNATARAFTAMGLHLLGRIDECRDVLKGLLAEGKGAGGTGTGGDVSVAAKDGQAAQAVRLAASLAAEIGMTP